MKKIVLLCIWVGLSLCCFTQNTIQLFEYWFDEDFSGKTIETVTAESNISIVKSINTDLLTTGLHVFNFRVRDNTGLWSSATNQFFFKTEATEEGVDHQVTAYEYWFDENDSVRVTREVTPSESASIIVGIAADSLSKGTHVFNFRVKDNTGMWSSVTSQEFLKSATRNGLVAYYPFNGNANDESGNENNGAVSGATLTTDRFGNDDSAFEFDGSDDYIEISHDPVLNISDSIAISIWIKYDNSPASSYEDIVMKGNSTYGFQFSLSDGQIMFHVLSDGWRNLNSGVTPEPNKWYHIVGTYDGKVQKIYINGELKATADWEGTIATSTDPLYFGYKVAGDNNWYKGSLDDFRLYNRSLTATEVDSLYHESGWPITPRVDLMVDALNYYPSEGDTSRTSISPSEKLTVSWQVENSGDSITGAGWSEQVSLVTDSGESFLLGATYYNEVLPSDSTVSRQAEFTLPSYPGIDGNAKVQVRVIPNAKCGEASTNQQNNIVQSVKYLFVNKRLYLSKAQQSLAENNSSPIQYQLFRSGSRSTDQKFKVSATPSGFVTLPADSITIPAGSSGTVFRISPIDNAVLNSDTIVAVSASGSVYTGITDSLRFVDDEIPSLTVTTSKTELGEGESFTLTVERELVTASSLTVYLTCSESKRFDYLSKIEIPANGKSKTITILALNDNVPALDAEAIFTVSALNYSNAISQVVLHDDDIPDISLVLIPDSVNESAGSSGVYGIVRRTGNTDSNITISLSSDSESSVYFLSDKITLAKGVTQQQFSFGIIDNALVDGNKTVTITAAVYLSSCSCSASVTGAGSVQSILTILDDDGPSLKIETDQTMLLEGAGKSNTITVSRNTSTENPLTVTLTSKYAAELSFPIAVTIPAGKVSIDVPVSALANDTTEGDRIITIEATVDGYSKGICWMMITDQNLPDAVISDLIISDRETTALGQIDVSVVVANNGATNLPVKTKIAVYISKDSVLTGSSTKTYLTTLYTQTEILPGEGETVSRTVTLPDFTGHYYITGIVNETQSVRELSYLNNNSGTVAIKLLPQYDVTASVEKTAYLRGDSIEIAGIATKNGIAAANVKVEVYLINSGARQALAATTDKDGAYHVAFVPATKQLGRFIVGACYPGEGLKEQEDFFDVYGIERTSTDWITWDLVCDELFSGKIEINNPCEVPFTNVNAIIDNIPVGYEIIFNPVTSIQAHGKATINYRVISNTVTSGDDYKKCSLRISSDEGVLLNTLVFYYCESQKAKLKADVSAINTTMTKGASRDYQFTITNIGKGETGTVSIKLPQKEWLTLASPDTISNLLKGDSSLVIIRLSPTDDVQLNVPIKGAIAINCENGDGLQLPFEIEPVSETTGTLVVDVCDEYTYYTEEAPHVSGATVTIKHPVSKEVIAQGTTNDKGLFTVENLPEGYYAIEVTANNHDSYSNNLLVNPGRTTTEVVNLSFQAITYTWEVTETEVEDEYEIETTVDYKTNVPVPVVVIKYPDSIAYKNYIFNLILTNKGLITAQDVTIDIPVVEGMTFEVLSENPVSQLLPQQSVTVPVRVTVDEENEDLISDGGVVSGATISSQIQSGSSAATLKSATMLTATLDTCRYIYITTYWYWYCSGEKKNLGEDKTYKIGECPSTYANDDSENGSGHNSGKTSAYPTRIVEQIDEYTYAIYENIIEKEKNCEKKGLYINFLAKNGYYPDLKAKVKGIVADGTSSIYIVAGNLPDSAAYYSLSIYSEFGGNYEACGRINKSYGSVSDLVDYSIVYDAPSEYPEEATKEYSVACFLNLYNAQGKSINFIDTIISVIRPPVLLVHGLNDSDTCFYKFNCYLKKSNTYYDFQIKRADYEKSNNDFFYTNRNVVSSNLHDSFFKLLEHGYVGTKADIIGHSMGGILARLHVQYVSNEDVHKLITLNTPHSGSQVANFMMTNTQINNLISDFIMRSFHFKKYDAINDLQVGSDAIEKYLNDPDVLVKMKNIPIHAVNTICPLAIENTSALNSNRLFMFIRFANFLYRRQSYGSFEEFVQNAIDETLDDTFIYSIFNDRNDGIVALSSQQGGLIPSSTATDITGNLITTFHTETPKNLSVEAELLNLLQISGSSSEFSNNGFIPKKLVYTSPFELPLLKSKKLFASGDSYIRIDSVKIDGSNQLTMSMNYSEDTYFASILGVMSDQQIFSGYKKKETFTIPASYKGDIKIYAVAQTESGDIISDSTVFTISDYKTTPDSIVFEDSNYELLVGSEISPKVLCYWHNGDETYIEPEFSTDSSFVSIVGNSITGEKEGTDTIRTSFYGLTCKAPLIVYNNEFIDEENDSIDGKNTGVCSSISLKFSQTMTVTRQAFRGTLTVFNGHQTDAMQDVKLNLEIKDEDGNIATEQQFYVKNESLEVFTRELDSTWTLEAQQTGKATILFVPSKLAAPTEPVKYSFGGTLSYLDPFSGTMVTRDLYPVTLTVNPSPELNLDYFVQRDVLGDDPLTDEIVEPSSSAEFSLLINNVGYGDAKNVKIQTNEPKIVDNQKGLLIDLKMVGSSMSGQEKTTGFSNINFGTIPANSTAYAQWYFESSLLGHFVKYSSGLTKGSSYGGEEFNLINNIAVHELIHTIKVGSGLSITGFLVNDIEDNQDLPDIIYSSDGSTMDVAQAATSPYSNSISTSNHETVLTVTPNGTGWNYVKTDDPGNGLYKIVSVTRGDGKNISLTNVWQTAITLKDVGDPVHENKIHLADEFATNVAQTYTIVFEAKDKEPLEVVRFENVPDDDGMVTTPVTSVRVVFNKPIDQATFTYQDLSLKIQGTEMADASLTITKVDNVTYSIDLSSKSGLDGYYVLTVQTSGITDQTGVSGAVGKSASWKQFLTVPAIIEFNGLPANNIGASFDYLTLRFNMAIDPSSLTSDRFTWKKNGTTISVTVTIDQMDSEGKLFKLSGLAALMTGDGNYSLTIDMSGIKSATGTSGMLTQGVQWKVDETAPEITQIIPVDGSGYDEQHHAAFMVGFNEQVVGFGTSNVELWKNGEKQTLPQLSISALSDTILSIVGFGMATYYEGNYTLKIKMANIFDLSGNSVSDTVLYEWHVDRTPPLAVTAMCITPDMGYSTSDNITATKDLVVSMMVNETCAQLKLYVIQQVSKTLLADTLQVGNGTLSLPVSLPVSGNIKLVVSCFDEFKNEVFTELPAFIDGTALTASWKDVLQNKLRVHPSSLQIELSDQLLDDARINNSLSFEYNGQLIDPKFLAVTKSTDQLYIVSGFDQYGRDNGTYCLSVDLSKLSKYRSGALGTSLSTIQWVIENNAPIANAGINQIVNEGSQVTLNGSTSSDTDGDLLNYKWVAPDEITLNSNGISKPTFTAPEVKKDTIYVFTLVVNDGLLESKADTVHITVRQVNKAPDANAGEDQTVNEGSLVTLNGLASTDFDGDTLTFKWSAPLGVVLSSDTLIQPTFIAPEVKKDTSYIFTLVVNDGRMDSQSDSVKITVKQVNKAPIANAGVDQKVNGGVAVNLDGSFSFDPDKQNITFFWTSPEGIVLNDNTSSRPEFISPKVRKVTPYTFILIVNDGIEESLPDTVIITVRNINVPDSVAISDFTIYNGSVVCFNALNNMTLAGNGKNVIVQNGAVVSFIAGESIRFLSGFHAFSGSDMDAYISVDGTFCETQSGSVVEQPQEKSIAGDKIIPNQQKNIIEENKIKLFPNPTTGKLNIEIPNFTRQVTVEIYSINGKKFNSYVISNSKSSIDLSSFRSGVYFLKASDLEISNYFKIIKID
jgi:triacylglycerol esterase/lipase EstA (alpha/beta hydrolase family)